LGTSQALVASLTLVTFLRILAIFNLIITKWNQIWA